MPTTDLIPQRSELLLRVLLQNLLLMMAIAGFAGFAALGLLERAALWQAAAAHAVVSGALLLCWCHHGVRTMQLKAFILLQEDGGSNSWEVWLPANRPTRMLGTRWMISTKGVFLGLQIALAGLAAVEATEWPIWAPAFCLAALLASAAFLLTNPKE